LIDAVHEVAVSAKIALAALTAEEADADPVSEVPPLVDTEPDGIDLTNDFMSWNNRPSITRFASLDSQHIAMAHTARQGPNPDISLLGLANLPIDEGEISFTGDFEGPIGGHTNTTPAVSPFAV